ncbi:DUF3558 family protein [Amycolatopsis sp. NPDC059021]|uniref:DUF3558 family protein n=1 Tax=Amycolatopsis sp. NPDC059021 TaxID=3346704 RepID=UPI0036735648
MRAVNRRRATTIGATALVLTAAVAAILLADAPATAPATPPTPNTTSNEQHRPSEPPPPPVTDPLDIHHFLTSPCDALAHEYAVTLLGEHVISRPDPAVADGPVCLLASTDPGIPSGVIRLEVRFPVRGDAPTVAELYAQQHRYALFEPLPPILGYPVAAYGQRDDRATGQCRVTVAVSDTARFDVDLVMHDSARTPPCLRARDAAAAVISTLHTR